MSQRPPIAGQGVLVTGGAGFIGSHLVDRLLAEGAREIVVIDNLFVGTEDNLAEAMPSGRVHFYRDDAEIATSLDAIFSRHRIDTVFNCATKALNYSFVNPANAFATNVNVVLNLLEIQRRGGFRTLCHFSTSEVYGSAIHEPMDEGHPRHPTTTYAAGKAAADLAVESYVRMFELNAYIVRPFNNYGPRQNHKGMLAALIPITAWRILHDVPPEQHGDGTQRRDFIHVLDTVDAVIRLHVVLPAGESVNIATDNPLTVREVLRQVCDELGYPDEPLVKPARQADVLCHIASTAKIRSLIDYSLTPFDAGLKQTLAWYRTRFGTQP